ncbi:MAG: metallophosphoesterase, partial [Culicoidibacterales bacterium]
NGNHDLYHGGFAFNGENGDKQEIETVSYAQYQAEYANFGYSDEANTFKTVYFGDTAGEATTTIHPELSYVARPKEGYVILALNSQLFTTTETGEIKMNGAGFNEDLLQWAEKQIQAAQANGETVIAMMHQGLLPHAVSSQLSIGDAIISNYEEVATRLADAGLRYVFTGHMHENDIAEFTTPSGNTIYDIETAATPSYGSPVRTVEFAKAATTKNDETTIQETAHVSSESVKATANIDDLQTYIYDAIYADSQYLQIKLGGALESIVNQIAELNLYELLFGDATMTQVIEGASATSPELAALVTYAENNVAPLVQAQATPALLTTLTDAVATAFDGQTIKSDEYGKLTFSYDETTQALTATDKQGVVRAEFTIEAFIKDIVKKIDTHVLDAGVLNGEIKNLITNILNIQLTVDNNGEAKTLQDVLNLFLIDHFLGAEDLTGWAQDLLDQFKTGEGVGEMIDNLIGSLLDLIPTLLNKAEVDVTTLTTDKFLQMTINLLLGKDKGLYSALNKLGIDLVDVIKTPLDEYLDAYITPSFEKQMGTLLGELVYGLAGDDTQDDAIDGAARILTYTGIQPQAPSVENGLLPHSVAVTFGTDETTQKAFSWYTGKNMPTNEIQFVKAVEAQTLADGEIDFSQAISINAESEIVSRSFPTIDLGIIAITRNKEVTRHQVVLDGLQPGTKYYYRVGDAATGIFTEAATFETAAVNDDSFTFLNFADTQSMLESEYAQWGEIVDKAFSMYPETKFVTHAGDMVDNGKNELQWQWFLNKPQADLMNTSLITASGNHEDSNQAHTNHFNIQELPAQDLETGAYYKVDYGNVLVMVVNTNNLDENQGLSAEQIDWLTTTAQESDAKWKIVQTHKAPYSNGSHYKDEDVVAIRKQFDQLVTELDIDFVLQGHDHTYARSHYLVNGEAEADVVIEEQAIAGVTYETAINPEGTVYALTGTTGPKFYTPQETGLPLAFSPDIQDPVFASISVDGDYLTYRAYTMDLNTQATTLIDSFAIEKTTTTADTVAPTITGVEDGGMYYLDRTVQVSDNSGNVDVTINGVAVNGKYEIPATYEAKTYEVVARDQAGNTTTTTFTMQALPTVDQISFGSESLAVIEAVTTEFEMMKHTLYAERVTFFTNLIANLTTAYEASEVVVKDFIGQVEQLPAIEAITAEHVPTIKAILAVYANLTAEELSALPAEIIAKIEAARVAIQVTSLTTADELVHVEFVGEQTKTKPYFELGTTLAATQQENGVFTIDAYLNNVPTTFAGTLEVRVELGDVAYSENHHLFQIAADGLTAVEVPTSVVEQTLVFQSETLGQFIVVELATAEAVANLQSLVQQAQAIDTTNYTATTVAVLEAAITTAQAVIANAQPTASDVQASTMALQAAITSLEEKVEIAPEVNKTELNELIAVIQQVDFTKFTNASVATLQAALANAQAVADKADATQAEVEAAISQLQTAFEQLVEKQPEDNNGNVETPDTDNDTDVTPPSVSTPQEDQTPDTDTNTDRDQESTPETESDSTLPNTGDQAIAAFGTIGLAFATMGAYLFRKRKY